MCNQDNTYDETLRQMNKARKEVNQHTKHKSRKTLKYILKVI